MVIAFSYYPAVSAVNWWPRSKMLQTHFQLHELSSHPKLLALTFRDSKLGSVLVPYHLALHYIAGFFFDQNKPENKIHHKHHALYTSPKISDWKKYICCLCCMKNLLSEKVAMFPDILTVRVTEGIKRCTFNQNLKSYNYYYQK